MDDFAQTVVDVGAGEDMIARFEPLNERRGDRQAGREDQRVFAAVQRGEALLERVAIGIFLARVAVAQRVIARGGALESRGEVNGRSYGPGRGIDAAAGMNRDGLDFHNASVAAQRSGLYGECGVGRP